MKQVLPLLFLCFLLALPASVFATISFVIENPTYEGDYYIVDATLSGISSSSAYVFGVFTHTTSANYFGSTWGQKESWVGYQSFDKDFIVSNFPILQKDVNQKIWIKPNYLDSGYKGPGEYHLKLRRYTGSSDNSAGDSNILTVQLTEPLVTPTISNTSTPTQTPATTTSPTSTPSPTRTPTPTPTRAQSITASPTTLMKSTPTVTPLSKQSESSVSDPSVLGASTSSPLYPSTTTVLTESISASSSPGINPPSNIPLKYTFIFGVIISSLSGGVLYFRHRNG